MRDFREHAIEHLRTAAGTYIWAARDDPCSYNFARCRVAKNDGNEPFLLDAAPHQIGSNARQTGRSFSVCYAYS
jgi:hypothetical protein